MADLFKRVLSPFVQFQEGGEQASRPAEGGEQVPAQGSDVAASPPGAAGVQPAADGAASYAAPGWEGLAQDPEVQRVEQAIALLASLPLGEIPPEKARDLIVATLRFAGLEVQALLDSFHRVHALFRAAAGSEQAAMAERTEQHRAAVQKLETALAMERQAHEQEITERTRRVEAVSGRLAELEKASAFFAVERKG